MNASLEDVDFEVIAAYIGISIEELHAQLGVNISVHSLATLTTPFDQALATHDGVLVWRIWKKRKALWKALNLADTFEQAKSVRNRAPRKSRIQAKALQKMLYLSITFDQAQSVYNHTLSGSEIEAQALQKLEAFMKSEINEVTTSDQAKSLYDNALQLGGSEIQVLAEQKLETVLKLELDAATTINQVRVVYNLAPRKSGIQAQALLKLATFFPKKW